MRWHVLHLRTECRARYGVGQKWKDVESDEEIDPEEERRKAEEAEKQRLLEEELKKVWKADPIDEDMATSDKFGRKVNSALNEFLQIEDYAEVILCFQELRNHTLHEKVAVKIIEKGMDNQPEKNQTLLADVLVHMKKKEPYMLTKDQIEGAFKTMEGLLDDLVVDFPKAKDVFALMKKRCQVKVHWKVLKQNLFHLVHSQVQKLDMTLKWVLMVWGIIYKVVNFMVEIVIVMIIIRRRIHLHQHLQNQIHLVVQDLLLLVLNLKNLPFLVMPSQSILMQN